MIKTQEEIFNALKESAWLEATCNEEQLRRIRIGLDLARQQGAAEQREKDADKIYQRAIEIVHRDSHVGAALVDMSEAIRTQGEEGGKKE